MHKFVRILLLVTLACAPAQAMASSTLIVAGKSLGFITRNTTEADIQKKLDPSQYKRVVVPVGEGFGRRGLLLYPGTDKEIAIVWKSDKQQIKPDDWDTAFNTPVVFKNPDFITITAPHSPWRTREGIAIGTPLKTLERINGRPFVFAGFKWDYAGRIYSWNEGNISSCLGVDIGISDETASDLPTGDVDVDSDSDFVKKHLQQMSVKTLFVAFPEAYGGRCN